MTEDRDLAIGQPDQIADGRDQGGLAGAVRAEQAEEAARRHLEVERVEGEGPVVIALGQAAQPERGGKGSIHAPMIAKPSPWVGRPWRHRSMAWRPSPSCDRIEEGRKWGECVTGSEWTCARCGVIVTFMPGAIDSFELPSNWDRLDGVAYCL